MDPILLRYFTIKTLKNWEKIISKLLSESSRTYQYFPPSLASEIHIEQNLLDTFQKNHHYFAFKRPLIGHVSSEAEDVEITQKLLIDAFSVFQDPFFLEQVTGEILSKVLAYRTLKKGTVLYIPTIVDTTTELIPFEVDAVFNLWRSMRAYGLKSIDKNHPNYLLFRGTDLSLTHKSSRISIISNFDSQGPGYSVFAYSKQKLIDWLKRTCQKEKKAKVIGYSLGGALASYLLIEAPHYFSNRDSSLLFNQPGLKLNLLEKFQKAQEKNPILLRSFIAEGDPVSKYGYLFCETIGLKEKDSALLPFEAHTKLFCAASHLEARRVNIEEENQSDSRQFYSKIHAKTTSLLRKMGVNHYLPNFDSKSLESNS